MRRETERPSAVLVVAIFHFIFGGLGLLCDTCALASPAMKVGQSPAQIQWQAEMEGVMAEKVPFYKPYLLGGLVLNLVWDVLMVGSGIGLLNLRPWGRKASIVYGVGRLVWGLIAMIVAFVWISPASEEAMQRVKLPPEMEAFKGFMSPSPIIGVVIQLLFLIYPAIVLFVMFSAPVRLAFAGGPPQRDGIADDDDDDDDDDDFGGDRDEPDDGGIRTGPRA